jgi:translation elongation factor EF-1alpha
VTHWYSHVQAAIVRIDAGQLRVGDVIRFEGHTTDFEHRVTQMEMDHRPVEVASAGQVVGIRVADRVREHDRVYRVRGS